MNTISTMLEALKDTGARYGLTELAREAIAAGEAELAREPDGYLLTYTQTGASALRRTRPTKWERASWTFEPVYTREETK
jgi:hypothetical protein